MAMVTKYLLANVKEEIGRTNELMEETLQNSRDVICMIEKIEVEMKDGELKVELEKKELEQKIIELAIENEESEKKVNTQNTLKQDCEELKIKNRKQTEIIEDMKKKLEKYEFILNIDKYRKTQ